MAFDGQQQRKALTALERVVGALGKGDTEAALRAAGRAAELDQLGVYEGLPDAVAAVAGQLAAGAAPSSESWEALAQAVGPGPVGAALDELRARSS